MASNFNTMVAELDELLEFDRKKAGYKQAGDIDTRLENIHKMLETMRDMLINVKQTRRHKCSVEL